MQRPSIPTANYAVSSSKEEAMGALELFKLPVVIKPDGRAGGRGVLICETQGGARRPRDGGRRAAARMRLGGWPGGVRRGTAERDRIPVEAGSFGMRGGGF